MLSIPSSDMAGTRDFLAEAFETVGQSLLAEDPPPPATPAAATPTQTQEVQDQPPHAQGPDPPDDDPDPWLLLTGATTAETPASPAATPAALNLHTPAPPPRPTSPASVAPSGTLQAAVSHIATRTGLSDVVHKREWALQQEDGGASARAKVFKEQALVGPLQLFAFMQPGNASVNVFHSAAVYFDPTRGDDAAPKTIAFVGDRSPAQGCITVA